MFEQCFNVNSRTLLETSKRDSITTSVYRQGDVLNITNGSTELLSSINGSLEMLNTSPREVLNMLNTSPREVLRLNS